jgi:methylenetetrahydrofolate dehydrogenase (NADP+)/methenyltetrahydrofolate cyclohydrolase
MNSFLLPNTRLLKGIPLKNRILLNLKQEVGATAEAGKIRPSIGIVQIGNNPRSDVYVHKKKTFGHEMGAIVHHVQLPDLATCEEIRTEILEFAHDASVHGILIQMPLPKHISQEEMQGLMDLIPLEKDVDGLTTENISLLGNDFDHAILPATARAVCLLLEGYEIPVQGQKAVVIGRSNLVGRPTALMLMHKGAEVSVCHRDTKNTSDIAKHADILVVATGVPGLVTPNFTNSDQTIIDVGISVLLGSDADDKIVGDVDFAHVAPVVKNISPVPGGVGPLTVAALFLNLMDCYRNQNKG